MVMITSSTIISSNFSSSPLKLKRHSLSSSLPTKLNQRTHTLSNILPPIVLLHKQQQQQLRFNNNKHLLKAQDQKQAPIATDDDGGNGVGGESGGGGDGGGEEERDWTTSFLLFGFWCGVMYYVFFLAPNQTPMTDMYLLRNLLNLTGDDGFQMNHVFVSLWYIMGLWPFLYSMLLLPSARSSKSKIPVWPFVTLSFFGGAYALIPYFILWTPPAPPVKESELTKWPLNFLESKLTAAGYMILTLGVNIVLLSFLFVITVAAGLGVIVYACLSGGDEWREYYQYFKGSKFIHVTSIDFSLLSTFAPFWVYNDMTIRKWEDKGSWLLPLSLIPFLGPALYLLLRPSLPVASASSPATPFTETE